MRRWRIDRQLTGGGGKEQHSGWLPAGAATPPATAATAEHVLELHIEETDEGFFLLVGTPQFTFDSWHATFHEAVEQARADYQVDPGEWLSE